MKRYNYYLGGIVLAILISFFCYSCMTEKDSSQKTPDQAAHTAFNPEIAGIGHNKCLDIFYGKLQQLKSNRTRTDELSKDDAELEEAMIESLVECLQNLEVETDVKEKIQTDLNAIIEYCDQHPDEGIKTIEWSEGAHLLANQLQEIVNTDYADAATAMNAITNIETKAKQTLSEPECNSILISTAIARHSLEYWDENQSIWFPTQTRSRIKWSEIARADCQGALDYLGFGGAPVCRSVAGWLVRSCKLFAWEAELALVTCFAAIGSVEEAINQSEDIAAGENDITEAEISQDLSNTIVEKAIRIFIATDEEEATEEEAE